MILINTELTKVHMCRIAKKCGLKNYSKMKKCDLLFLLRKHFASLYISRYYSYKKNKHKQFINKQDPLTQCDLVYPFFEIEITKNKYVRYNMLPFYTYMFKTGHFKDPYTDIEFTDEQLKLMDNQMKKNGYMKQSLFMMKNNPNRMNYYKKRLERENCLLGMDRQIGELLTNMCDDLFDKLQNGGNVEHTCYHTLSYIFLPNLVYLLDELKKIDIQYTRNCLYDYISWVKNQNVPLGNIITNMLKKELNHLT